MIKKDQQIFIIEKLLIAHVVRLLWSRRGSNPVPFGTVVLKVLGLILDPMV
jgi:hypothetical protein